MSGNDWVDIVLLLALGLGLFLGYSQGLLRQIIFLASLYLGAILATQYYRGLGMALRGMMVTTPGTLLNVLAFFAIMTAVLIILGILSLDAGHMTIRLPPAVEHLGGMVLGLVSTWILIALSINLLSFATGAQNWADIENVRVVLDNGIQASIIARWTDSTVPTIVSAIQPWLPSGLPSIFHM